MTKNGPDGDLHNERKDYRLEELRREQLDSNPFALFDSWLQTARDKKLIDATAMTLATATSAGAPSARIVLLKQFDAEGFCWYTNYESRKGAELSENKQAALLFYWCELERQIRIEGVVEKVADKQSSEYFNSRPAGSKFSAASSPQSKVVSNQAWLANATRQLQSRYTADELPRPSHWGGYRLKPHAFEFWQGRPSRLHDRFRYKRQDTGWLIDRLGP